MRISSNQLRGIIREEARRVKRRMSEGSPFNEDESEETRSFVMAIDEQVVDAAVTAGLITDDQRDDAREAVQVALEQLAAELKSMF